MAKKRVDSSPARRPARRRSASRSRRAAAGARRAGSASKGTRRARPGRRRWALPSLLGGALIAIAVVGWLVWPSWRAVRGFATSEWPRPSLVYGRPQRLSLGERLASADLAERLRGLGYRLSGRSPLPVGAFTATDDRVEVALRSVPTPLGPAPERRLSVRFDRGRIRGLSLDGGSVDSAELDPPLLGLFVGDDLRDRRAVRRSELPDDVVHAVLAAEDSTFFEHPGISLSGLLRALVVNLRSGEVQQGGSTLTQQLVKNLYLTPERTLPRKIREGVLSLLVERRFTKEAILEAYLNEAYWGRVGGVSLMGLGAAARAWFGCEAKELDVAEAALLAGMLRSPGGLDPARHPAASRARRDEVLERMYELGWLDQASLVAARAVAPRLARPGFAPRTHDYFLDAVAREARRRYGLDELRAKGYVLLTTLDPDDQLAGEEALERGLRAPEEKGAAEGLQGALLSIDPRSGGVVAWVGGRSYKASQFDRVEQARRQPGSAFKPMILTAAFVRGIATPSTLIEDAPLVLEVGGRAWEPHNADHEFRGWVTARQALEDSVNVAAVRLGERTGWDHVVETARALGVDGALAPLPSLGLGAVEVTPLSLATAYASLASGGLRTETHLLRAVLDPEARPVDGHPIAAAHRVVPAAVAFQVSHVLEGVLDRGTAAAARSLGVTDPLAGKTGTTNGGRDSWFVGFSPDRATLVWVGYDDNRGTRLSGNRAALPIWSRFVVARRPPGGYPTMQVPPGIHFVEVDPETGGYAGRRCPTVIAEAFLEGTGPETDCYLHAGGRRPLLEQSRDDEWHLRRRPWWRRGIFRPRGEGLALPPVEPPR